MNRELENWQTRELKVWRRDVARVAERHARRAWGAEPKADWRDTVLEIGAIICFLAGIALFVWLCCAVSDYHFA